jgi:hypothetical protein
LKQFSFCAAVSLAQFTPKEQTTSKVSAMNLWGFDYSIDVEIQVGIVYEKIYGVWKRETAEQFTKEFEKEVAGIIGKPWVRVSDLTNWKTATPEAVEIIGKHLAWCRKNNLAWSVNIIDNKVTEAQLKKMIAKGGTADLTTNVLTRLEADHFLRDKGFLTNTASPDLRK